MLWKYPSFSYGDAQGVEAPLPKKTFLTQTGPTIPLYCGRGEARARIRPDTKGDESELNDRSYQRLTDQLDEA